MQCNICNEVRFVTALLHLQCVNMKANVLCKFAKPHLKTMRTSLENSFPLLFNVGTVSSHSVSNPVV
jgi:hypothetical protein